MNYHKLLFGLILFTAIGLWGATTISSEVDDELQKKRQEIEELQQKLSETRGQSQTLASTIAYLNNNINLTQAQISETETQLRGLGSEIAELTVRITALDATLDDVTQLMLNRINNSYKRSRFNPALSVVSSDSLSDMVTKNKYLMVSARHDREIIFQMEEARTNYDTQKTLKEQKQAELDALQQRLESQRITLARQQEEKEVLLQITRNDERRFQTELAQKRAELEAIQSIIAGRGQETEVGEVSQGETIAYVIPGPSTCSTGAHLHFEIARSGSHRNPANYLSSRTVTWNNGPDGPFEFSGDWPWPLRGNIRITQGYGMTFYAATMRYYGGAPHTGIDMVNNNDYTVRTVADGTLYRGSVTCRNAPLRYVRVDHGDGLSSYYLHVNY